MRKYHGQLIHHSRDEFGPIDVIDDGLSRSLHFGNEIRQSAALLNQPEQLVLTYTRAMMACLLFNDAPGRVLLIGLGGGSLAKFLLHHFPNCEIHALERRAAVAKLAYAYFQLPDTPRLRVHVQDAAQQVYSLQASSYDLILLDAYDEDGMAPGVAEQPFLQACLATLAPAGLLVANLWRHERRRYKNTLANLRHGFGQRPLQLPVEGTTNIITLNARHALPVVGARAISPALEQLEIQTGLKLGRYAQLLYKHNTPWWVRAFA